MADILATLKALYDTRGDEVEAFFITQRKLAAPHLYTSVDLRHDGVRLAPVDTNLFPAGFQNLSPAGRSRAGRFFKRLMEEQYSKAQRVLIIPENHTRNLHYFDNLQALEEIFGSTGVELRFGSLAATDAPIVLENDGGKKIAEHPLRRNGNTLSLADGFTPDLIVMNNDMTSGAPAILQGLSQSVQPPLSLGWWRRSKSVHFKAYREIADAFAKAFGIDPWLISAYFQCCGRVDFKEQTGLECVAQNVEKVLASARAKHKEYGIAAEPYVFIKADSGTYGMGIMTVRSGEEIFEINKKTRNKMQVIKEGARVEEVIVQEGIPTTDEVKGHPAEPMVYMVDGIPVGGMFRVNPSRDRFENLNAGGMEFTGMCDEIEDECGKWKTVVDCDFRSYGIIAALAALAAGREDALLARMETGNEKVCSG